MMNVALRCICVLCFCISLLPLTGCGVESEKVVQVKTIDVNTLTPEQRAQVEKNQAAMGNTPGAGPQTPQEIIQQKIKEEQERQAAEKAAGGVKK